MAYIKANDRIGTTVNGFYIKDTKRENKYTYALVVCPYCKKEKWMRMDTVARGINVSCGCYNAEHNQLKAEDISNMVSGRLKAIKPTDQRDKHNGAVIWECQCTCGNKTYVSATALKLQRVKSCGCLPPEVHVSNGKKMAEYVKENFVLEDTSVCVIKGKKIAKNNTSGICGVRWEKRHKRWLAQIEFKKKRYYLGEYKNKEDAVKIRKRAEKEMFGNFLEWYAKEFPERWEKLNKKETLKKDC